MSFEKFTPGKWVVEEHELAVGNNTMVGFRIRTDSKIICAAYSNELKNKPEMQANAALIAAAPVMYALLSLMVSPTIMMSQIMRNDDLRTAIEAVLKKARGEE